MGVATPPIDITDHCSSIFNNTLYLFSPAGFQSLSLSVGAKWQVLSPGISVDGGECVNAIGPNESSPALYIVGGRANSTQPNFPGLQRFIYSSQTWETITPQVPVSQNRQNHGAAYLNQTAQIVVYAGSQDPSNNNPSSQTFLISTAPPYNVLSYISVAPPLTHPMVMPWNASHAVMVGGDDTNKDVYLFSPAGWSNLGVSLIQPITDEMTMQCTIMTGDDGTKVLETYNLGTSPNTVSQYLLFANGQPAPSGIMVGRPAKPTRRSRIRRQLTVSSWPAYNASGAATTTRSGFAVAQAPNGIAVISGGGPANDPIEIFQERQNNWVDVNSVFGNQVAVTPSPTAVAKPSSTSSAAASSVTGGALPTSKALTVLGGALGGVLGFAALLILVLLLMRGRADKMRRKEREQREANEKENRLSFADQGTDFMRDYEGVRGQKDENTHSVVGSISSLQIFGGKSSANGHRRGQPSDSSTAGLVQHKSPIGAADDLELSRVNNERLSPPSTATRVNSPYDAEPGTTGAQLDRSTGWSQYFNNDINFTNLAAPSAAAGGTQSFLHANSMRSSDLSTSSYEDTNRQLNTVRPLNVNLGPRFEANAPSNTNPAGPGRAISTSSYDRSHWSVLSEDRNSHNSSILAAFPSGGSGPLGNAFARPDNPLMQQPYSANQGSPASPPSARDFPMPRAYYPPNPAPPPNAGLPAFPRPRGERDAGSPGPRPTPRGPVLRKMTGSEDMSWLNINAAPGRPT
jgi:hypothetical protein